MIDIGSTVLEVSRDSETQKEIEDVARCLHVLYTTPMGSQEGNRLLGIDRSVCLDKPMEIANQTYGKFYEIKKERGEKEYGNQDVQFEEGWEDLSGTLLSG